MADQAEMQSAESRMLAMLDDVEEDAPQEEVPTEEVAEEEETEDGDYEPETEGELEGEDSDEQPEQSIKLKVNGEEIDKPFSEVVALAQQGLDYTKKTQEVAEQRKELEAYAQTIQVQEQNFRQQVQLQNALIGDVAQLTNIDQRLEAFNNVNWQELSDNDFVEAQKLFFTYNQLQQTRSHLATELEAKSKQITEQQNQLLTERIAKGKEVLAKEIPNWSRDTSQQIISTGKEYGFTDDELGMIVDPRHVKVLHDAMQWRKLQSNSVVKNKVTSAKPVVKPGAKDTKNESNSQFKQQRDSLRKTGKSEYAQQLIERMI
jgi:hypothetical protein